MIHVPRSEERRCPDAAAAVYARDRSASMQQIAASAGISRTTLVRHFPTREDLVVALIDRVLNDATAVLDQAKLEDGDLVRGLSCLTENFRMLGQVWGAATVWAMAGRILKRCCPTWQCGSKPLMRGSLDFLSVVNRPGCFARTFRRPG